MRRDHLVICPQDRAWIQALGLRSVRQVLRYQGSEVAAMSRSSDVQRIALDESSGGPPAVYLKRYFYRRPVERLKQSLALMVRGKSRARLEYDLLSAMHRSGVPVVRPVAFGEHRRRGLLRACFLITEGAEGFRPLDTVAGELSGAVPCDDRRRRDLVRTLAAAVLRMHDAGITHGSLFFRNILVAHTDGGWRVRFVDPGPHARVGAVELPLDARAGDLADLAGSAFQFAAGTDLIRFMHCYLHTSRLDARQKRFARALGVAAGAQSDKERHRVAVRGVLDRLHAAHPTVSPGAPPEAHTVEQAFERLARPKQLRLPPNVAQWVVVFDIEASPRSSIESSRTVTLTAQGVAVAGGRRDNADLYVRTDRQAFLSVVSDPGAAMRFVQQRRFHFEGDMKPLGVLIGLIGSGPAGCGVEATDASLEADRIARWESQYQSAAHARYYAYKHDATLRRRISNTFERNMIGRALARVSRVGPVRWVLDCPSGAGRFLPTLARLDARVLAMDTAFEMLREGVRHRDLFSKPPVMSVGSALALPMVDRSVDAVLCARLIHHFPDADSRVRILAECARVARVGVVVSFFDVHSYGGWRRRRKLRERDKNFPRQAISRAELVAEADQAGLELLGMNALLRYHAEVTAAAFAVKR